MITVVFLALTRQHITSISALTSIIFNTSEAPMVTHNMYIGILVIEPMSSVFVLGGCVVHGCLVIVIDLLSCVGCVVRRYLVIADICWGLLMVGHVGLIVVQVLVG